MAIPAVSGETLPAQTSPVRRSLPRKAPRPISPASATGSIRHRSTLADLRGKVVLVDFWTYGCVNCVNTLPHVTELYAKYKDRGFVVVGVHTPEFPVRALRRPTCRPR